MRRLLVVLLCFSILLPCIYINVNAEENYTFYKINIDSGSGIIGEKAIVQNGEIYIPSTSFSNYTRFAYDEEDKLFLIKGQEIKKAFKTVKIDSNKKRMLVSGTHLYELSDCFEIEGELYLPLCQMLPVLNAEIYKVENDVIYIANNQLSLAEVLYDFDISEYYFNMSSEFQNMTWAASLAIIPNYILDTVVNVRFDRLDIIFGSGKYNDYKNAFSDLLSEDNLYLKAMAQEEDILDETLDFFNKANSTAKNMRTAYKWVEAAGETKISSETGGMLLESLQAYYNSGDLDTDDLKQLNDAWNEKSFHHGTLSFGDCIELMNYTYTYTSLVEDNRQMLNAVYDVDEKVSKKENVRRAAQRIYELYGEDFAPALVSEIVKNVASDELENLSPIGIYTTTAKVAGTALKMVMPFSFEGIASLPTYSDVVLTASSKYSSYDTITDESTENLRLSLLLCMLASKRCFEAMDDVLDKDKSYYKNKIEKIDRLITGLYITAENTSFDSFEHFEEYKGDNLKKVSPVISSMQKYSEISTTTTATQKRTTTTKKPTTTTTAKQTTSTTSIGVQKYFLSDFVGKTVGDVHKTYGKNYSLHGYNGGIMLNYGGFAFVIDDYYEEPKDYRRENREILYAVSYSDVGLVGALKGAMTYPEIVAAIGKSVSLDKPKYWGDGEFESMWEYTLDFEYQGYTIMYEWLDDPNKTKSVHAIIQSKTPPTITTTTTTTTKKTTTTATSAASNNTQQLLEEIKKFLENGYLSISGFEIISMKIYNESDEILTVDVKTTNPYADYAFDYYKKTRVIEFYNTGNFVFSDTLP